MSLRIGAGAGFAGDRIAPARDLAERGRLDFIAFECLAERTLAYGHLQRAADPNKGFHPLLDKRLGAVLAACVKNGTTIVTNMGVANPAAAGRAAVALAQRLGLKIRIAVVTGDDIICGLVDAASPTTETVEVKKAHGWSATNSLPPSLACEQIRAGAERAVRKADTLKPVELRDEWTLEIVHPTTTGAELAEAVPGSRRISDRTISHTLASVDDILGLITVNARLAAAGVSTIVAVANRT